MAIGTTPLFSKISGSAGPVDFRTRRNGKIEIGKKRIPANPQSTRQLEVRAGYGRLHELWQNASYIDKAQYERLGKLYNISAWNAFLLRHQPAMSAAPVASWGMVESSGLDLHDLTTNENHGTISGAVWEEISNAKLSTLHFDGIDDCVDCGLLPNLNVNNSMFVSAWIQSTDIDTVARDWPRIFGRNGILYCRIGASNSENRHAYFHANGTAVLIGTSIINDGTPHLITGVRNTTTNKFYLYVDGIEEAIKNDISGDLTEATIFQISYPAANKQFSGNIWNVIANNTAPTQPDILHYYNTTKKLYGAYP